MIEMKETNGYLHFFDKAEQCMLITRFYAKEYTKGGRDAN
jgi:hypothetical protein